MSDGDFPVDSALPPELRGLLEWELPEAVEEDVGGIARSAPRL